MNPSLPSTSIPGRISAMGELYALAAAVVWSCAVILFRRSGETVAPLAMNLFRVAVSGALFLVLLAVTRRPLWGVAPLGDYLILGACNPKLAHRALQTRADIGLMLPCNVTLEEVDGAVRVSVINPRAMFDFVGDPAVEPIAAEADKALKAAFEAMA